jgi:type VI protein secretion system component VasK
MMAWTYPLLDIFWTMLWFFAFIVWIWVLVAIFVDIFRSHDIGGFAKALWFLFVLFVPLLGVLVYLIARGSKMHERAAQQAQQDQKALDTYVEDRVKAVNDNTSADELTKLAALKNNGEITESEYDAQKAKILA